MFYFIIFCNVYFLKQVKKKHTSYFNVDYDLNMTIQRKLSDEVIELKCYNTIDKQYLIFANIFKKILEFCMVDSVYLPESSFLFTSYPAFKLFDCFEWNVKRHSLIDWKKYL